MFSVNVVDRGSVPVVGDTTSSQLIASSVHVVLHPSPSAVHPSSHCSLFPVCTCPSPQCSSDAVHVCDVHP